MNCRGVRMVRMVRVVRVVRMVCFMCFMYLIRLGREQEREKIKGEIKMVCCRQLDGLVVHNLVLNLRPNNMSSKFIPNSTIAALMSPSQVA